MAEEIKKDLAERSSQMVKLIIESNKNEEKMVEKIFYLESENKELKNKVIDLELELKIIKGRLESEFKDKISEMKLTQKETEIENRKLKDIISEIISFQKEFQTKDKDKDLEIKKLKDIILENQKEFQIENRKIKDKFFELEESISNNKLELLSNLSKTSTFISDNGVKSDKTNTEFSFEEVYNFFRNFMKNQDVEDRVINYKDKDGNQMEEKLFDLIVRIIHNGKLSKNISGKFYVEERKLYDAFQKHIYKKNQKKIKERED